MASKSKWQTKAAPQPLYSVAQLTEQHAAFGTAKFVAACALRLTEKPFLTKDEAERAIQAFRQRKVR